MACLVAVAGCAGGAKEEKVVSTSDDVRVKVFATADQAVERLRALNPDLQLKLDYIPDADDRWSSCSDTPVADTEAPDVIQWLAYRTLIVEPRRETATLIDPVVARFVAEGWTLGMESKGNGGRSVNVKRDGYTLNVGGVTESLPDRVSTLSARVYSPCIKAPANIRAWKPTGTPSPSPSQ